MDFNKLFSLEGKVALVTGAAYGIGFAMAEAYAKAGAKIAFNCRSQHHMDQALADYKAKGIEAKGYICDVTDEEQVKNMVADAREDSPLPWPKENPRNLCFSNINRFL